MPREQINFPSTKSIMIDNHGNELELSPGADVPVGSTLLTDPELHVSWQTGTEFDGHVQVMVKMDAVFIRHLLSGMSDGETANAVYTPILSRAELNKLIRVLRVARDKAYGRDE